MANPIGVNQLSPHGYGDAQAQQGLLKEAPISGAPTTNSALATPQRNQRRASQGSQSAPNAPEAQMPPPTPTPAALVAGVWATLGSHPESSELVRQYAQRAQQNPA